MATATQITTGRVRFSYVNAFTPRAAQEGAQPKYSVTLLIPKTDKNTIAKIKAAIEAAKTAYHDCSRAISALYSVAKPRSHVVAACQPSRNP